MGVDLSSTSDLTAVVALLELDDDRYLCIPRFFVPEDGVRRRSERDGVNYALWADTEGQHVSVYAEPPSW